VIGSFLWEFLVSVKSLVRIFWNLDQAARLRLWLAGHPRAWVLVLGRRIWLCGDGAYSRFFWRFMGRWNREMQTWIHQSCHSTWVSIFSIQFRAQYIDFFLVPLSYLCSHLGKMTYVLPSFASRSWKSGVDTFIWIDLQPNIQWKRNNSPCITEQIPVDLRFHITTLPWPGFTQLWVLYDFGLIHYWSIPLQDNIGLMPYRRPMTVVSKFMVIILFAFIRDWSYSFFFTVGHPIHTEKCEKPSIEEVLRLQELYINELTRYHVILAELAPFLISFCSLESGIPTRTLLRQGVLKSSVLLHESFDSRRAFLA